MNKRITISALTILFITFLIAIPAIPTTSSFLSKPNQPNLPATTTETIDMLIFISPQYAEDIEINKAIQNYATIIKTDLNWNTKIIKLTNENNNYKLIDQTIENYYTQYKIKACLMVGEDINTALSGDTDNMEQPSTIPWATTGGETSYEISPQGIICKPYKIDICISLIYPTSEQDYSTKKQNIITAFNKFTNNRKILYNNQITILESSDINQNTKQIYQQLTNLGNINYKEDILNNELKETLTKPNSLYIVHGHSNPSGTNLNKQEKTWFSANQIDNLNSPVFLADGCYVAGWWSNQIDNNQLDKSINKNWYGEKIFTSKNVKLLVLGPISQNGYNQPVSFVENALPDFLNGNTISESIIGKTYVGNIILTGDPTLRLII